MHMPNSFSEAHHGLRARAARNRIGIDIGGTFTDFVLDIAGKQFTHKVLSTTDAPERAVLAGLNELLQRTGLAPGAIDAVLHGTTLATNAVIERRGARTAFLTTEGFRDVLETGSESRADHYDLMLVKPQPLIPRALRLTVPERIGAQGQVLLPLDRAAVAARVRTLVEAEVTSVAIGFLHSYANAEHERAAAEIIARALPGVDISLSSEISPEMREYERFSTTCVNAYIQPLMRAYLEHLRSALDALGVKAPMLLMLSNGGLCDVRTACREPVRLLESGPAGGAILAATLSRRHGFERVLSLDIGGTTAKLCFIDDHRAQTARLLEVARQDRFKPGSGIPLRIPVIELSEIGAGGGSIAQVDPLGRIAVGPQSAGSMPGPACYQRGGTHATLTDAHLHAGRLDPAYFAAGTIALDAAAAIAALDEHIAAPLGLDTDAAAYAIAELADEAMAQAAREHAVETGRSIAGRVLIAFGGSAPLHAARLADKLDIDRVLIPARAGVGSALGFLHAPLAFEASHSLRQRLDAFDHERVASLLDSLAERGRAVLEPLVEKDALEVVRDAFVRYEGQGHELRISLAGIAIDAQGGAALAAAFSQQYAALYGRSIAGAAIEAISWAVSVSERTAPELPLAAPADTDSAGEIVASMSGLGLAGKTAEESGPQEQMRPILDQSSRSRHATRVLPRTALQEASVLPGPAVILDLETTIVVPPSFTARVLAEGDLMLERRQPAARDSLG